MKKIYLKPVVAVHSIELNNTLLTVSDPHADVKPDETIQVNEVESHHSSIWDDEE